MHTNRYPVRILATLMIVMLAPVMSATRAQEPLPSSDAIKIVDTVGYIASVDMAADFDHDGYGDLAIGVPYEDIEPIVDAGLVNVIYGTDTLGLSPIGNQMWYQGYAGAEGVAETSDLFGVALAVGDFDGDNYMDLAVGIPYQDVSGYGNAGAVHILYGSGGGLTATNDQLWTQDSPGILGGPESNDWFGNSLAVGDFDGDGYDDLVVGVSGEDIGTINSAGAVNVIYGTSGGLSATDDQIWYQDSDYIQGASEELDQFGYAVTAGDFNSDGYDDLAVGVIHESVGSVSNAGAVNVIYGSANGLITTRNWWFHQDMLDTADGSELDDIFGWALSAGDYNGDGFADLAVGVPGEDITDDYNTEEAAGAVNVVYGSRDGLTTDHNQFWHQDSPAINNYAEDGDRFGRVLTSGDFNGDQHDDLAVGIPYEDNGSFLDTGAVHIIYGSTSGLTSFNNWCFMQGNVRDTSEEYDYFGRALAAGDFDQDGYTDLAIGVPYEDVGTIKDAGAVNVVYGSSAGLTATDDQFWHQDVDYIQGKCETGDRFGYALASLYRLKTHIIYTPMVLK